MNFSQCHEISCLFFEGFPYLIILQEKGSFSGIFQGMEIGFSTV